MGSWPDIITNPAHPPLIPRYNRMGVCQLLELAEHILDGVLIIVTFSLPSAPRLNTWSRDLHPGSHMPCLAHTHWTKGQPLGCSISFLCSVFLLYFITIFGKPPGEFQIQIDSVFGFNCMFLWGHWSKGRIHTNKFQFHCNGLLAGVLYNDR
jgi:hypothetical protein